MRIKTPFSLIVIAGNWNMTIFRPDWVKRFLFPEDDVEVKLNLLSNTIKILTPEVSVLITNLRRLELILNVHNDSAVRKVGETARSIARHLPHTPVTNYGINFVFTEPYTLPLESNIGFCSVKSEKDSNSTLETKSIKKGLKEKGLELNLDIAKADNQFSFYFNFHYNIDSLEDFLVKCDPDGILCLQDRAIGILKSEFQILGDDHE